MNWSYAPIGIHVVEAARFVVNVYPKGSNVSIGGIFYTFGMSPALNSTTYVHNQKGEFYLRFDCLSVKNYTVVIEQNLEPAPDYSLPILVFLFATGIVTAIAFTYILRKP